MKNCGNWSRRLPATALFVGLSVGMLLAASSSNDEHAGYQGIPVRNGLNRGLIQPDEMLAAQRYPSLPRRKNETDFLPTSSIDAQDQHQQNSTAPDRAGYAGIPQRNNLNPNEAQAIEPPQTASIEHAGYGGIPQPNATNHMLKHPNSFSAKRASAIVKPK